MERILKYLNLPDPLKMNDGAPVTKENWPERQKEILDILQEHMFGYFPEKTAKLAGCEVLHHEEIYGGSVDFTLYKVNYTFPTGEASLEIPVFLPIGVENPPCVVSLGGGRRAFENRNNPGPFSYYPPEYVFKHGVAVVFSPVMDATTDDGDFTTGIGPFVYPNGRKDTDGGKLVLWGVATSMVADFVLSLGKIDAKNLGVAGCSRLGKGALAAGLYDERFQFINSVCSGCGGTAILRGKVGETVGSIMNYAPFWFSENFRKFSDCEETMPFDAHFIIAALAPRKVLLTGAIEDFWCDPYMEMVAAIAAGKTYEMLGLPGFIYDGPYPVPGARYPVPGDFFQQGSIGFSLRSGGHGFPAYDWERIADFLVSHKN